MVGHEIVEAAGGEVVLVDILPGHSTTSLVARARGGQGGEREHGILGAARGVPGRVARSGALAARRTDVVVVLIALSLPWSTSLVGIFGVVLLMRDLRRRST